MNSCRPISAAIAIGGFALVLAACDSPPAILYISTGTESDVMSLTDAKGECELRAHVAYISWAGQATAQGCWTRERGDIVARFPGLPDRRIPVGEFQRTELAEYRSQTLD